MATIVDVTDSVMNTTVMGAIASGGNGGNGANGGDGGLAQGGGIAVDVQSPTGTLDVTISGSILLGNDASGGSAGSVVRAAMAATAVTPREAASSSMPRQ